MSIAAYRADLRAIGRGAWLGVWRQDQLFDLLFNAIDRGLTRAWTEGAKQVGIAADEITPAEQLVLSGVIFNEYDKVGGLIALLNTNTKKDGHKLGTIFARLELWVNRYKDVVNRAKVEGEKDPKLKWSLGPTKNHCYTCGRLSGKIKRASWWRDNVMPQQPPNPSLECGGWKCGCGLEPTDEPMSRGRMPNVP